MPAADLLADLQKPLREHGWDRKPTGRMLAELLGHTAIAVTGVVIAVLADHPVWRASGLLVSTLGTMGVATNSHTSSHYATSDRRWVNEALTYFGCPFFLGFSATYWWDKHLRHHPVPNVIGMDADLPFWPLFALTDEEVRRSRGLRRLYYTRLQWLVLPFALAGQTFSMQASGWRFLVRTLWIARRRRPAHLIDLAMLVLHLAAALVAPMVLLSPAQGAALYAARFALFGYAIFFVFGPAHLPAEAPFTTRAGLTPDRAQRQVRATLDFRTGRLGTFVCSGLQYQIEHHLFPSVSHVHYPAMSRVVEELCRRRRLPYRRLGWGEGIWKAFLAFKVPKPLLDAPAGAPGAERSGERSPTSVASGDR